MDTTAGRACCFFRSCLSFLLGQIREGGTGVWRCIRGLSPRLRPKGPWMQRAPRRGDRRLRLSGETERGGPACLAGEEAHAG